MADAAPGLDLSPSPSPSASGTSSRRQALDSLVALAVGVPTFAKGGERLLRRTPPRFVGSSVRVSALRRRLSDEAMGLAARSGQPPGVRGTEPAGS
jgi:hypothetical protein